jgi:hypothetical protein
VSTHQTHQQLAEQARQMTPGIVSPVPSGSVRPEGMAQVSPLPTRPDSLVHPSGGPHPQGNTGQPDAFGVPIGPNTHTAHDLMPESISLSEIQQRADRYGENSGFWEKAKP